MQKHSFRDEVLRPRALTRRARGWRPRVRGLRPVRGSLGRPMLTLHAPPLRLGRIERPAAAHRLVLRIRGPRVVLRERFSRLTTREFMRVIGVPANARVQDVHELHDAPSLQLLEARADVGTRDIQGLGNLFGMERAR